MRIIPFVSFPADYFPLILPSNHLATSISDYLDTICSGAIFIKFNFLLLGNFFHSIQPEPLDIYPFHQNLLIISSRLFLPFPFPLLLRCYWDTSTIRISILPSPSLLLCEEHLTFTRTDRKEPEQRRGNSL